MMKLPPWAEGPFEIILHGEDHFVKGGDFDRRMALISFDNAIEVAISTYLSLNPIHRENRSYQRTEVERWSVNFHSKLDFLEIECATRNLVLFIEKAHFVWYHDLRNRQYHEGSPSTPNLKDLKMMRDAAIWVFSVLFGIESSDAENHLSEYINQLRSLEKPAPDDQANRLIDNELGLVEIGDQLYYASEVLYAVDYPVYRELGMSINATRMVGEEEGI